MQSRLVRNRCRASAPPATRRFPKFSAQADPGKRRACPTSISSKIDYVLLWTERGPGNNQPTSPGERSNAEFPLTNAGPQNSPVVLQTHLTAGEQVCDGRDRLFIATSARTDCQNQIA